MSLLWRLSSGRIATVEGKEMGTSQKSVGVPGNKENTDVDTNDASDTGS